ncbi:MAG: hypothetical protein MZV70_69700 [Desulfobacterales bacterium]|nr:hypothetical protein [Desulfobacterales bacterium]
MAASGQPAWASLAAGFRVTLLKDGHSSWTRDAKARIVRVEEELAARERADGPRPGLDRPRVRSRQLKRRPYALLPRLCLPGPG